MKRTVDRICGDVVSRSSKMSPTVLTSSRLRSMMGLSLLVRGNVCACLLGSRTRCRPSYRSSWLGGLMLVRLKSSSWKSVALEIREEQKNGSEKVRKNVNCAENKKAQDSTTRNYSLSLDAAGAPETMSMLDSLIWLVRRCGYLMLICYTVLYK